MNCTYCQKLFSQKSNRFRHQKHCSDNPNKIEIMCNKCNKIFSYPGSLKNHLKNTCSKRDKKKFSLKIKTEKPIRKISVPVERKNPQKKVSFIQKKVIDNYILERLIELTSQEKGIDFLLDNVYKEKYSEIIKTAFFKDLEPIEYPMVGNGKGGYRFLNSESQLINDIDGYKLSHDLLKYVQNAMLKASNILIRKYIALGDTNPLYDKYKLNKLQKIAFDITDNKGPMLQFLKTLSVPEHQFWENGY